MKKFFSLVLALVMALSLTTVAWGADPADYTIDDASDLLALSAQAFTGNNGTAEAYTIELLADIDMGGATFSAMIAQRGDTLTFKGNGHKISNVKVVSGANDNTTGQASMFYCYPGSTLNVSNLTLENITVTADADASGYAAAVVGYCEGTVNLSNVDVVNATVTGVKSSGMLVGHLSGSLVADGCDLSGTVTLADFAGEPDGHYAGKYIGTLAGNADVTNCPANVTVSGNLKAGNNGDGYGRPVSGDLTVDGDLVGAVAKVGGVQYKSLTEAMNAVTSSNNTLTLLDDVTISDTWDCRTNGAQFTVPVTIDGDGHKLTFTGAVSDANWNTVFRFEDAATVKNLTIDASGATGIQRGISSKGSIVVEECTLIGNGTGYGVIFGEGAGAANIGNVTATVTNSTFTNWAKGVSDNANAQDAKSVSITGSTFDNADVNVSAKETVTFTGNTVDDGSVIIHTYTANSDLAVTATGNTLDADEVNKIKAETITTDSNDFALTGALVAPAGYEVVERTDGTEVVVPTTLLGEKFDLYLANAQLNANLKAGVATVSDIILTEVPANTFSNGSGNVAYVKGNNGEYYVKTTTPYTTSYAVTAADKTTVLYYVNAAGTEAGAFTYTAKATEFKNFSLAPKCDYVTGKPVVGATYFQLADGTVYMAADASATEANNYLVGDTVYSKGAPQTVVKHTFKANNYKYDAASGKNIPTSAICTTCLTTSSAIYLDEKVPAGVFAYDLAAPDAAYAVVVSAPAFGGTVVTPSTDKVQSAETFDAGIAMYVGMSVMAAAGSAVVIGKKKD